MGARWSQAIADESYTPAAPAPAAGRAIAQDRLEPEEAERFHAALGSVVVPRSARISRIQDGVFTQHVEANGRDSALNLACALLIAHTNELSLCLLLDDLDVRVSSRDVDAGSMHSQRIYHVTLSYKLSHMARRVGTGPHGHITVPWPYCTEEAEARCCEIAHALVLEVARLRADYARAPIRGVVDLRGYRACTRALCHATFGGHYCLCYREDPTCGCSREPVARLACPVFDRTIALPRNVALLDGHAISRDGRALLRDIAAHIARGLFHPLLALRVQPAGASPPESADCTLPSVLADGRGIFHIFAASAESLADAAAEAHARAESHAAFIRRQAEAEGREFAERLAAFRMAEAAAATDSKIAVGSDGGNDDGNDDGSNGDDYGDYSDDGGDGSDDGADAEPAPLGALVAAIAVTATNATAAPVA